MKGKAKLKHLIKRNNVDLEQLNLVTHSAAQTMANETNSGAIEDQTRHIEYGFETVERVLTALLMRNAIESADLDFLVQDASELIASRVNNQGLSSQIEFLEKAGFSAERILKALGVDDAAEQLNT